MFENMIRVVIAILVAVLAGKAASKLKMPAVLGFLIAGMAVGPYALDILNQEILDLPAYHTLISFLECGMGLMLGSEMILKRLRSYGKQIVVITMAQSLMTFVIVSLAFSIILYFLDMPVFLSLIFGGIALATAPAPALSIVTEYKTDGPVTKTLLPLAVIDDVIAICVFLSVMGLVLQKTAGGTVPKYMIILVVLFPLVIGGVVGFITSFVMKKINSAKANSIIVFLGVIITGILTMLANHYFMPIPVLNFMLSGMVYSAVFVNLIEESKIERVMSYCTPTVNSCFAIIILNLGAPLDYHLIVGAGIFTVVYIVSRAIGKIGGASLGANLSNAASTVKKYLGMVLLPHSGVSLVLTGIAISALTGEFAQYGNIVRGTIAAAAVINEIIAVFVAREGFKRAGEMGKATLKETIQKETELISA